MPVLRRFKQPGLSSGSTNVLENKLQQAVNDSWNIRLIDTESCFYIQVTSELTEEDVSKIEFILSTPLAKEQLRTVPFIGSDTKPHELVVEIGPRLNFSTAFSTNAVSICHSVGVTSVDRLEVATRYRMQVTPSSSTPGSNGDNTDMEEDSVQANTPTESGDKIRNNTIPEKLKQALITALHDKMTECVYEKPVEKFDLDIKPEEVYEVDVIGSGQTALEKANADLGLAFDSWDLDYYTDLFVNKIKRNPTSVECFDLAQSNSEHSRHWFFKGRMVVDGVEQEDSLFKMVMSTQKHTNSNNVIKFNDNSSAIEGYKVYRLKPKVVSESSSFECTEVTQHIIFTAETHNFPTGVAPFPGATTGTGGRIRDVQATGRGAHVIAGTAGYSFGNLNIPDYSLPWEDPTFDYPPNFAPPCQVAVEASNGASDYGNKFGEPVLCGFARSFGMTTPGGERREWIKPIMFSGGIGSLDGRHVTKELAQVGMSVVKVGGPVYRIGVGGGAASSIQVQGDNTGDLDFGAVQRGDAEMEQKMNRVVRACVEMGADNPISSIHDQGAGGNGNVLKEISEPAGAVIRTGDFQLGDPTLSVQEIWGAEYQESNALLVKDEDKAILKKIGNREKCAVSFVGDITGDGKIRLEDTKSNSTSEPPESKRQRVETRNPVDLDLDHVLGSMPRKVFKLDHNKVTLTELSLPENLQVRDALARVLKLPSVASKRYLTNKVDRSVTGLVAQQQCVGPLHTPLSDMAVVSLGYDSTVGGVTSIGEQPIKGLIDAKCGARMTVAEALTNIMFARVSDIKDIKCSGNWMWAAKLPGEGALLYDACSAMCEVMGQLGVGVDGGKDSLSMAARVGTDTVKAPGTLVVSAYVGCPDITNIATPDFKCPEGSSSVLHVSMCPGKYRLGGSALAQCYKQLGNQVPDLEDVPYFVKAFNITQKLLEDKLLLSGHDVSDGGLITCILEMAFAGNCGVQCNISSEESATTMDVLFSEELGFVLEVADSVKDKVVEAYTSEGIQCRFIGHTAGSGQDAGIKINVNGTEVLSDKMTTLRDEWEATSFRLEKFQANPNCVLEETNGLKSRTAPLYSMSFDPEVEYKAFKQLPKPASPPKLAVIREEGSNGDREMVSAFYQAGFEVWDVNTQDLAAGHVSLASFRGVVFVGGFSYADVMGSAKGWAAALKYNPVIRSELEVFYKRDDTFSLGVCNGCQLMALLGWVGTDDGHEKFEQGVHLTHNNSERYESRFVTVKIEESASIMLKGMQDSSLGIWVAHGEGKFEFQTPELQTKQAEQNQVPIKYVDDEGNATTQYPLNPNGSPEGIAALCSTNGRHLAMMPHPERCVLPWQWAWMPYEWKKSMTVSPWLQMFINAYKWCLDTQQ